MMNNNKKSITIRIDKNMYLYIKNKAEQEKRSFNFIVNSMLVKNKE